MNELEIPYDEISEALRRMNVEQNAAEIHGGLCGLFCTVGDLTVDYWLDNALINSSEKEGGTVDALSSEGRSLLVLLFSGTQKQLFGQDFAFELFLPDDDARISLRLEALSYWCQGFLYGLSQGGLTDPEGLPGDLAEIVRDILEISRAESYELNDDEQDEKDVMELVEYVRVGIQLFLTNMQPFQEDEADESLRH